MHSTYRGFGFRVLRAGCRDIWILAGSDLVFCKQTFDGVTAPEPLELDKPVWKSSFPSLLASGAILDSDVGVEGRSRRRPKFGREPSAVSGRKLAILHEFQL